MTLRFPMALALVLGACGAPIPNVSREPSVSVVFDPSTSNLPTPNDLALLDGVVALEPNPALSDVENELKATFNGRGGWSSGSSARVQFSGALSAASITDQTVLAFDLGEKRKGPVRRATVARAYTDCDHAITVTSPTGFAPGHTYLFAVIGEATENAVLGAGGERVTTAPAFHLLRAGKDLTQHLDAFPGAEREVRRATAQRLEAVRQQLEPLFQVLETQGVTRRSVVALWHFTVHSQGEVFFDPAQKKVPFPNDLLKDPATGLVALPGDPTDSPESSALKQAFNQLDGFSTTAALSFESTAPIDRKTVTPASARLFTAGTNIEVTNLTRTLSSDGKKLTLQPTAPLLPGQRYVVLLAGLKDVAGAALAPMPLSSVLSLSRPLVDAEKHSAVSSLCDATATQLETVRASIAQVEAAAGANLANLNGAWAFTTQDILKRTRELWSTAYVENLPLTVSHVSADAPVPLVMSNVAKIYSGKMSTFDRLDPTTRAFKPNGAGTPREIDFILTTPKSAAPGSLVKTAIYGHGLFTERRLMLMVADKLASIGFATFAIDFPYHGERSACTTDAQCSSGATCAKDGSCLKDGAPADFLRVPIPGVPGKGTPSATGQAWINVEYLPATRDHFRQALIDLSAQTRLARGMDWKPVLGGIGLDPNEIHWVGISLGGIVGSELTAVEPNIKSMLLNVPGANLVRLIRESLTFKWQLQAGLSAKGITEGTPAYEEFVNAAKWMLDEVDPLNLAPYAMVRPWTYQDPMTGQTLTAPKKRLRIQEAIGDTVVPNACTQELVDVIGIDRATQYREFVGTHGFLADPTEPSYYLGLNDMAAFLENK